MANMIKDLGVSGDLQKTVLNFLTDRQASVKYDDAMSCWYKLRAEVPQGSVLGPKLFSLYTMGMENLIGNEHIKTISYADDTYVVCTSDNLVSLGDLMTSTIHKHCSWLSTWQKLK